MISRLSARKITRDGRTEVRAEVRNTGQRTGTAVVQLYVTDDESSVAVPEIQLRGFTKVSPAAGATATVRIPLRADDLALVDSAMRRVVEPGTFTLSVGTSATALPHNLALTVI